MHPDTPLAAGWQYLVSSSQSEPETPNSNPQTPNSLESLNFADLAAGSGHILTEAFDLFYECYMEEGYTAREAVESILKYNLAGLDLDPRAAGLARFAVLLKAAKRHREILTTGPLPNIWAAPPPRAFNSNEVARFLDVAGAQYKVELSAALVALGEAYNLGSIVQLTLSVEAREYIAAQTAAWEARTLADLEDMAVWQKIAPYLRMLNVLAARYWCLAANPPYMGQQNMNGQLKQYVNGHYPNSKNDLFAVFIELMQAKLKHNGLMSVITMEAWMFLSSYERLRKNILTNYTITSLTHFGWHIIGIAFGTVVIVLDKKPPTGENFGEYSFLEISDIGRDSNFPRSFPNKDNGRYVCRPQADFWKIPSYPIAYWISERKLKIFDDSTIGDHFVVSNCVQIGEPTNNLRTWWELNKSLINSYWKFCTKGGDYRKWYGNTDLVIRYGENMSDLESFHAALRTKENYFNSGISWTRVTGNKVSFRIQNKDHLVSDAGPIVYAENPLNLIAYCNTNLVQELLELLNPTINYQTGNISSLPAPPPSKEAEILASDCIFISRTDWDSHETSWDFQTSPLIATGKPNVEFAYAAWLEETARQFYTLHANEEALNRIFIGIYGLEAELSPEVPLKDITILQDELDWKGANAEDVNGEWSTVNGAKPALQREASNGATIQREASNAQRPTQSSLPIRKDVVMQQLISYAIGCAMGRYRLDKPGLHIAHPAPTAAELAPYVVDSLTRLSVDSSHSKTSQPVNESTSQPFAIDDDAIIPLMGAACSFRDDAARRLSAFLAAVWGEEALTANLNFITTALGCTPEEYLVKSFWKTHCRTYSKKPIYWLFTSPKGAFQVLVYMHRLSRFTVAKIRTKYLQPHIAALRQRIKESDGATDKQSMKAAEKLRRDLADCEHYDGLLNSPTWEAIEIDLDNGVTRNYALYKGIVAEIK